MVDSERAAQEAVRRTERQLTQLIDAVPARISSTTREGTPSYLNQRFTDVTGATLEDIPAPDGSPSLSIVHPDDRAATGRSFTCRCSRPIPASGDDPPDQ